MATLAQEELSRFFHRPHLRSHPEDLHDSDRDSADEKSHSEPAFTSDLNQDTDSDSELHDKMTALTTTKSTYILPATAQYANTGPKGVIADAQSFTKAKRDALKRPLVAITNLLPHDKPQERESLSSSEEEEDDDFMLQWRANRLAELAAHADSHRMLNVHHAHERRVSPSRRTYGNATRVDAAGYLDAVEKVPTDTTVIVMIYDPDSADSVEVEDEIDILAYKHGHVRFVKLDYEVAEMEQIQIPALLAYKNGEVYATISGAKRSGLEGVLSQQGVFN